MKKRRLKNDFYNCIALLGISLWFLWALFQASSFSAALYRWLGAQGQVHYSTTSPTVAVDNLEIKQGSTWQPFLLKIEEGVYHGM